MTLSSTQCFYHWLDATPEEQKQIFAYAKKHSLKTYQELNNLVYQQNQSLFTHLIDNQAQHLMNTDNWSSMVGETVGKYQVVSLCGQGGMGAVFLANRVDELFQQQVAIKFYRSHLTQLSTPQFLLKEAQVLASLNHSSIPKVYDAGLHHNSVFIVMEYIEGETLTDYLNHSTLSTEQRYQLCLKICRAVEHAHNYCLLHADLKPQNILITKDGKPKVLDFNIVQPSFTHESPVTMMLNTYSHGYSSPEQEQGQTLSTQSDIFSLGKIVQHILMPDCHHYELNLVLDIACHDEPSRRYQSVSALIQDLENLRNKRPIVQLQNHLIYCIKKSFERHKFRWMFGVIFVTTLLGLGIAITESNQSLKQEAYARDKLVKELANLLYVSRTTLQTERDMASIVHNLHDVVLRTKELPADVKTRLVYGLMLPISDKQNLKQESTINVPYKNVPHGKHE
ncbi:serine/threonine protein kinase [Vibrio astriarenae]|uniref:serine/threonine protein kinase n=1 Tax=Vibrio astriarenae TaxID=1481923 RepID=UPI003735AD13